MTTPRRSTVRLRRPNPFRAPLLPLLVLLLMGGCRVEAEGDPGNGFGLVRTEQEDAAASDTALEATLRRATALADSVEDLLRPVPLMRPADEEALRQYPNAVHVRTARELGVRPEDASELPSLVEQGRLVRLEDTTPHWVVRELGSSHPYVTPETRELLERLGAAFQERLEEMGLPPYRFEISSVLRTAESQAALRQRNVNAAAGTSAHEFGTTVDIAYSGYAAPAELPEGLVAEPRSGSEASGEARSDALERVARAVLERVAARKSRELKAVLGEVLREAQSRGEVLVTLERQQPVYHLTRR